MLLVVMVSAAGLAGCATTKAAAAAVGPPLSVPAPPPRVLVPPEEEPLVAVGTGPDTPVLKSPPVAQGPAPTRRPTATRGDTEPRTETPGPAATAIGPTAPAEARELRAVPSADDRVPEQKAVQDQLDRVNLELKRIVPSTLSNGDKRKFEEARKFALQASEKLKQGNVPNAAQAVGKASLILEDLSRR